MSRFARIIAVPVIVATTVVVPLFEAHPSAKALPPDLHVVTLTAADFHPAVDSLTFVSGGVGVYADGAMYARVPFPDEDVLVTSIKVRAYDNHGPAGLCVRLRRSHPATATNLYLTTLLCTTDTAQDPQTMYSTVFTPVGKHYVAFVHASFGGYSPNLQLYGASVFYRVME
jgi:hypothetical protein